MNVKETLARVCSLAGDYSRGGRSPHSLFLESGYSSAPNDITIEAIGSFLRANPYLIGSWYMYSENKRTDRGWHIFFSDDDTDNSVEYLEGPRVVRKERYSDRFHACAAYVKYEFEHLASWA